MKATRVVTITEQEILAGLHDYEQDFVKREARCRRCGTTTKEALADTRKLECKGVDRGAHRFSAGGYCNRCGMTGRRQKRCPPGYWMTPGEAEAWTKASPSARARMETRLARRPAAVKP